MSHCGPIDLVVCESFARRGLANALVKPTLAHLYEEVVGSHNDMWRLQDQLMLLK